MCVCVCVWCILSDERVCCLAGVEWWVCRVNMLCGVCGGYGWQLCSVCVCVCVYCCMCILRLPRAAITLFPSRAGTDAEGCLHREGCGGYVDTQGCTGDHGHACIQFCRASCIWNPSCPLLSTNPGSGEQTTAAPWAYILAGQGRGQFPTCRCTSGVESACMAWPGVSWGESHRGTFMLTAPHPPPSPIHWELRPEIMQPTVESAEQWTSFSDSFSEMV